MLLLLITACGTNPRGGAPVITEEATLDTARLTVHVANAEDLALPVQVALERQLAASRAAPATLTVILEAGEYDVGALSLKDLGDRSALDLEILGADTKHPPVLVGSALDLAARRITVRDVVIADNTRSSPSLALRVGEAVLLERVALVGNTRAEVALGDPIVRVTPSYRGGAITVVMRQSWFIGNRVEGHGSLILVETSPQETVGDWTLEDVAFLGNTVPVTLAPGQTARVVCRRCFAWDDVSPGAFLNVANPTTRAAVEDSVLVLGGRLPLQQANGAGALGVTGGRLLLAGPAPESVQVQGASLGLPPAPPASFDTSAADARAGRAPDRATVERRYLGG